MTDTKHLIVDFDIFFISYDEPNAEEHYAHLLDLAPWANRVHGVKGFDAAHRRCAELSETDWFVTVDADCKVLPDFFNTEIVLNKNERPRESITWNGINMINGLMYGNGGIKLWSKEFVLSGGVGHETTTQTEHAVDFCWQKDYRNINRPFTEVWNNGSPYQAYRVGFREGVKLTLDRGFRVAPSVMKTILSPMNLRNIRIWSSVGADIDNGMFAIWGARAGWAAMTDPNFDHVVVRDYDWFDAHWSDLQSSGLKPEVEIARLGTIIERETGIGMPVLDAEASKFFKETFKLRNE